MKSKVVISAIVVTDDAGKEQRIPMQVTGQTKGANPRYQPTQNAYGVAGTMYALPAKAQAPAGGSSAVQTYKQIPGYTPDQSVILGKALEIMQSHGVVAPAPAPVKDKPKAK